MTYVFTHSENKFSPAYRDAVAALKPGDEVLAGTITTVTKVTPSGQIVLANGLRFLPDGRQIGGHHTLQPYVTDEDRRTKQRRLMVSSIRVLMQHFWVSADNTHEELMALAQALAPFQKRI